MPAPVPTLIMSAGLLEALDITEYNALSDANKERVKILLSCGTINLAVGSQARGILDTIFPIGTATNAAVKVLVGNPPI